VSVSRSESLRSAALIAGIGAAGMAPSLEAPVVLAAPPTRDGFYTVELTPDGRFVLMHPDRLTWIQIYTAEEMDAADEHACRLNEPLWLALKPRGLEGYDPPPPDVEAQLMVFINRLWMFELA
jgi:hypothetical protein